MTMESVMEGSVSSSSLIVENDDPSTSDMTSSWPGSPPRSPRKSARRRSACFMAVQSAVLQLYRINDFVMEKISEGFFAEVYKAQNISSGEVMVLKKNKQFKNSKQMLYEIQLMNRLSHPNILRYNGCCVHEGQLHALTEYMNAGTVEDWILSKSPILWSVRMKNSIDIANGMSYLHSKGVFHRDLTSKNCLLHQENGVLRTVVADFGLAADIQKYKLHHHNDIVGSPYWMAPECLYGKPYAEKADVFSYGIILAEIMARIPADPEYMPRTNKFGVDFDTLKPLCQGSPEKLWHLMVQCCQINPDSRPTFSQAVSTLDDADLSSYDTESTAAHIDNTSVSDTVQKSTRAETSSSRSSVRSSVSSSGRVSKDWRRHSSCSDPGDGVNENKGDSGIDPGVFFMEQSKRRLSSSCGALIDKMEEFTTFEELETFLRSYTVSKSSKEGSSNTDDTVPCSPSEHAKSSHTTSPQLVTPSVCKTSKYLPNPSSPCTPPPTPCITKIRPAVSMPHFYQTNNDAIPRTVSSQSSSPDSSPCVRRRRPDAKAKDLSSSSSQRAVSPEHLPENSMSGFCVVGDASKEFLYNVYPKRQMGSPPPSITVLSPCGSTTADD